MAKSVFFSFYYKGDAWRLQQIANLGAVDGQSILKPQEWEEVKRKGDRAIENWIDEQMRYKRTVVVLVGAHTADRRWVKYEIIKAWNEKRPLVGIRIHGLADSSGQPDQPGANPFEAVTMSDGRTIAGYVPLHVPAGNTTKGVYSSIENNIESWIDGAYRRP